MFEEKVVDKILKQVTVVDETVSKEALFGDEDGEEDGSKPASKSAKGKGGKKASKSE